MSLSKNSFRNSNIEILRLVLMFMVVLLHFNNDTMGGAFVFIKDMAFDNFALHFFESLSICAVNCFMIVSGYFLYANTKIKFGKIADVFLIVIFYRLLHFGINSIIGNEDFALRNFVAACFPFNYFAIFYVVCYALSPYIAKLWNCLSIKSSNLFITILLIVFIVIPTILNMVENLYILNSADGLSPISIEGNGNGYTIVQFVVMLSLGMWLRKRQVNIRSSVLWLVYLFSVLVMTIFIHIFPSLYNYCSVFTVVTAVCLFLLFLKLKFQSNAINFLSKSCFAIYCIHISPLSLHFWRKYFITYSHFSNGFVFTIVWMLVSVIVMFAVCLLLSIVMRLSFGRIKDKVCGLLPILESDE